MANTSSLVVAAGLSLIMSSNASFSLYMAHGGTNFGFTNGANGDGCVTRRTLTAPFPSSPTLQSGVSPMWIGGVHRPFVHRAPRSVRWWGRERWDHISHLPDRVVLVTVVSVTVLAPL